MAFGNDQGTRDDSRPREMHEGNWKCGTCGGPITKLPFKPNPDRLNTLKCLDCWKKSRPPRNEM